MQTYDNNLKPPNYFLKKFVIVFFRNMLKILDDVAIGPQINGSNGLCNINNTTLANNSCTTYNIPNDIK